MRYDTLQALLKDRTNELYQQQLDYAALLAKVVAATRSERLSSILERRLKEVEQSSCWLRETVSAFETPPGARPSEVMAALRNEVIAITARQGHPLLRDIALIAALQRIEQDLALCSGVARRYAGELKMRQVTRRLCGLSKEASISSRRLSALNQKSPCNGGFIHQASHCIIRSRARLRALHNE
jgi:ferritin-like metal-binding protein YciE